MGGGDGWGWREWEGEMETSLNNNKKKAKRNTPKKERILCVDPSEIKNDKFVIFLHLVLISNAGRRDGRWLD